MNELMPRSEGLVPISSTFCMDCVFAQFNEKKTQIGCKANRIEKFKNANIPITEITDDDTTAYIIEGKACVYYRNKDWATEYYKNISEENLLPTIQQELKIPYHAILFMRNNDTIDNVKARLLELEQQAVPPKIVTVVDRSHLAEPITKELLAIFSNYHFAYWRVQTIQAVDQVDTDIVDLVYDSTKKIPFMFYITFESHSPIPISFSQELHTSLHDDMKAFTVLIPNTQNIGGGALKIAHAKHAGNSFGIPLEAKIRHYDDAPHLIKKVEEICPSLQAS